ncbi:MAG: hypothetical protein ACYCXT_10815 [Acidiferrobacteraceae bacterium]
MKHKTDQDPTTNVLSFESYRDRETTARLQQEGCTEEGLLLRAIFRPPLMSLALFEAATDEAQAAGRDEFEYLREKYPNECRGWDLPDLLKADKA